MQQDSMRGAGIIAASDVLAEQTATLAVALLQGLQQGRTQVREGCTEVIIAPVSARSTTPIRVIFFPQV